MREPPERARARQRPPGLREAAARGARPAARAVPTSPRRPGGRRLAAAAIGCVCCLAPAGRPAQLAPARRGPPLPADSGRAARARQPAPARPRGLAARRAGGAAAAGGARGQADFWGLAETALAGKGVRRGGVGLRRFWDFVDHNAELRPLPPEHAKRGQKHNRPFYPGIRPEPFHSLRHYGGLTAWLGDHFEGLRSELLALPSEGFRAQADEGWSVLNLRAFGQPSGFFTERSRDLPHVAAFVEHLRSEGMLPPESMSLLRQAPGTGLEPHTDCLNMVSCCHVGLSVPSGGEVPWIECGGERRTWAEGGCLVFDQTFTHTTFNPTAEDRIVLAVDLWHHDLRPEERAALEAFFEFVDEWNRSCNVQPFAGVHVPFGWYTIQDFACCL